MEHNTDMIDTYEMAVYAMGMMRRNAIKKNYTIGVDLALHTPKQIILRTDNPKNDFWFNK